MRDPVIMLVDNGSTRPAATLSLRGIAARLALDLGLVVHPVSLQHADKVPANRLNGQPAAVFPTFLEAQLRGGRRHFVVLPLFFGNSRALTVFVPQQLDRLAGEFGAFDLVMAEALSPMPEVDPVLAEIMLEHVTRCLTDWPEAQTANRRVVVVDHGSPLPEVSAVKTLVARLLSERLCGRVEVLQAVMERRAGRGYDFNGTLLADVLDEEAGRGVQQVVLAMLFISPGSHAGPGGDIAEICAAAERRHPGLNIRISPLVGEHPLLVELLRRRLDAALAGSASRRLAGRIPA